MNNLVIIGNLTADPQSRITQSGHNVTSFTVAVNRRHREGQQDQADFFRVTAWDKLADTCKQYLAKGRKVAVTGMVSVSTYNAQDGSTRASLDVTANNVEFLSQKEQPKQEQKPDGYMAVNEEELPF